jgi:hypothetical protein
VKSYKDSNRYKEYEMQVAYGTTNKARIKHGIKSQSKFNTLDVLQA